MKNSHGGGDLGFLTVEEVAARCRVSDQTVRNWITVGKLKAKRLGGEGSRTLRIPIEEYERFATPGSQGDESQEDLGPRL